MDAEGFVKVTYLEIVLIDVIGSPFCIHQHIVVANNSLWMN